MTAEVRAVGRHGDSGKRRIIYTAPGRWHSSLERREADDAYTGCRTTGSVSAFSSAGGSFMARAQSCEMPAARPQFDASQRHAPCALCRDLRTVDLDFLRSFASHRRARDAATQAVVDCLGFCAYHGALIAQAPNARTADVVLGAVAMLASLFADEARNAERLEHLAATAERACAACRYREHRLARAVHAHASDAAAAPWCFPHYHDIAYAVRSDVLPALTRTELEHLRSVAADAADVATQLRLATDRDSAAMQASLAYDTAAISGAPYVTLPSAEAAPPDFGPKTLDAESCVVCREVDRAEAQWLDAVRMAARLKQDVWIVFPTCPKHIRRCADLGDAQVLSRVAEYAAGVQVGVLQSGVEWLARDNAAREAARQSVWYRPQSPAYILGRQRRAITRLPRCPACERMIMGRDGAVTSILRALRSGTGDCLARVRGLCLKHFAAVYFLLPPGPSRAGATRVQLERLDALRRAADHPFATPARAGHRCNGEGWRAMLAYLSCRA